MRVCHFKEPPGSEIVKTRPDAEKLQSKTIPEGYHREIYPRGRRTGLKKTARRSPACSEKIFSGTAEFACLLHGQVPVVLGTTNPQEVVRKEPVPGFITGLHGPGWRGDPFYRRHIHARNPKSSRSPASSGRDEESERSRFNSIRSRLANQEMVQFHDQYITSTCLRCTPKDAFCRGDTIYGPGVPHHRQDADYTTSLYRRVT